MHASVERVRNAALVVASALLAGFTVFIDEIAHGRAVNDEIVVDGIVGLLLAATAALTTVTVIRLRTSRTRLQRSITVIDAVHVTSESGQSASILARLPRLAVAMLDLQFALIYLRDRSDPRLVEIVAATGAPEDLVGSKLSSDEGVAGAVFLSGEASAVTAAEQLAPDLSIAAGGAAPIRWSNRTNGVLIVGTADPARSFDERDLGLLEQIAQLGAVALEQVDLREHLKRAAEAGVEALATAVDMRDNYTAEHSEHVVELACEVGRRLGLEPKSLTELEYAARLHDVGKIGVPDEILRKPGPLDSEEWTVMKKHPVWGAEMLARLPELAGVAALVRFEHERWDGGGYPDGLRGEEIPQVSRIVFACDAYHAMTSDRPYRKAMPPDQALRAMEENAGSQFDPVAVDALVAALESGEFEAVVAG